MKKALKANERELIKLTRYFSKRAEQMTVDGELSEDQQKLTEACENLERQLLQHADNRTAILEKRGRLEKLIEDNAQCPKCHKADMLKRQGVVTNEHDWKCNSYRCRRCNTTFTWNRPNNPWDMVAFLELYIKELEASLDAEMDPSLRQHTEAALPQLQDSLSRLRPVLQGSDEEVEALMEKEREMDKLIHQFKNYLLIEKIKLDTYEE
ncbi:hypothetical protein [Pontibacter chinhatensis]|uniref:Uncharacterized protein n=1 Tax=Pontibacter chinhatensis TaxID=1436961 RepID=A0A1I2WUW6_9BACT|nr:hypothetical protein [Pontibacter chinhatensis]SFH05134.1 hypothetical protein SAMN05421739_105214 [Pontibacter chinhatensis]